MSGLYHVKASYEYDWPKEYIEVAKQQIQDELVKRITPLITDGREWSITYYEPEITFPTTPKHKGKITGRILCVLSQLIHVDIDDYVRMQAIDSGLKIKETYVPGRAYAYLFERYEGIGWKRLK